MAPPSCKVGDGVLPVLGVVFDCLALTWSGDLGARVLLNSGMPTITDDLSLDGGLLERKGSG